MAADLSGPDPKALWKEQEQETDPMTLEQIHALVRQYDNQDRRRQRSAIPIGAPQFTLARNTRNVRVEDRPNSETLGIAVDIGDDFGARGVGWVVLRHRHERQAGMVAIGMEMQPVIMAPPRCADAVGPLQHDGAQTRGAHRRRAGEARRAGSNDEDVGPGKHGQSGAELDQAGWYMEIDGKNNGARATAWLSA